MSPRLSSLMLATLPPDGSCNFVTPNIRNAKAHVAEISHPSDISRPYSEHHQVGGSGESKRLHIAAHVEQTTCTTVKPSVKQLLGAIRVNSTNSSSAEYSPAAPPLWSIGESLSANPPKSGFLTRTRPPAG